MNADETNPVIDALIEHELALSRLYKVFADQFPDMKDFWARISRQETVHAEVLGSLAASIGSKPIFFNDRRFNTAAIQISLDYLARKTEEIGDGGTTLLKAFGLALDQERSMIENEYFEVFESDSAEIKKIFEMLCAETERHIREITSGLENVKKETVG